VVSLDFEDHPFERYRFAGACALCGATDSYLDEVVTDDCGGRMFVCSDTDYCEGRRAEKPAIASAPAGTEDRHG
jgi:alpha-D-ribose 1-methylphosphonate 5-phosphate C-P lyase